MCGTYHKEDVTILLKDTTGLVRPLPHRSVNGLIQPGSITVKCSLWDHDSSHNVCPRHNTFRETVSSDTLVTEYALVSNVATLLHRNEIVKCPKFSAQQCGITKKLDNTCQKYLKDERSVRCRIVDDAYVFVLWT